MYIKAIILAVCAVCAAPASAQDQELIKTAVQFASTRLADAGIESPSGYIFDVRRFLDDAETVPGKSRFGRRWTQSVIDYVTAGTGAVASTLDDVTKCYKSTSGRTTRCHLRPHGAVIAVGRPIVRGQTARVRVHIWLSPPQHHHPTTGEPFDDIYGQLYWVELERTTTGWIAVGRSRDK
jgi:hypothetical protein